MQEIGDDDDFASLLGPGYIDKEVRSALQNCWLCIAKEDRTIDRVEAEFRRIVERAIKDFRDDEKVFRRVKE